MGDIRLALILYTKVIHYQLKLKGECLVPPQARSNGCWLIDNFSQMLPQFIIDNINCLGQSIHAFLDFQI